MSRENGARAARTLTRSVIALGILAPSLLLAGCRHVSLEPDAGSVRRLGAQEAPACERVGTTHVEVLSKVLFVPRSQSKMSDELTVLARNSAARLGGNAVIAEGGITDGKQTFGVYRCPEDSG